MYTSFNEVAGIHGNMQVRFHQGLERDRLRIVFFYTSGNGVSSHHEFELGFWTLIN